MRRVLSLLVLTSAGLIAGGCATAGLALVGPLAGSLTAIADRSVERTLPADLGTTWGATADALARMAVRIDQADRSGPTWRLSGTGEAVTVHGALERVTASMTRVSVRVEAGGLFADKRTGDELLNQIATSLASRASGGPRDGVTGADRSSEQMRALRQEIERLGTKIEQAREVPPLRVRVDAPAVQSASPAPVITVPTSAGVATVPSPDPPVRPAGPSPLHPSVGTPNREATSPFQTAERRENRSDDILAVPMRSVEVLRPVEGLGTRPSGQ